MQFHPNNTPETVSEGQKSKIFLGVQAPYTRFNRILEPPFFKILDPPLKGINITSEMIIGASLSEPHTSVRIQIFHVHADCHTLQLQKESESEDDLS